MGGSSATSTSIPEACAELPISTSAGYRAVKAGTFPVPVLRPTPRKMLVSRVMLDRYRDTGQPIASVAS